MTTIASQACLYARRVLLSDRDIRAEIASGRLGIDPFDDSLVQPSSVDVRLDNLFRVFNNTRYTHIDPARQQDELTSLVQARNETTVMVEDAVTAMRREDRPAGDTLGAILGLGYDDDTDPDQLARLGTALHLSQRHINNMWIPASGWGYQA